MDVPTAIPVDAVHFLLPNSGQPPNSGQWTSAVYRTTLSHIKASSIMDNWAGLMWAELRNSSLAHAFLFASQPHWEYTCAVGFWQ